MERKKSVRLEILAWIIFGISLLIGVATRFLPLAHYVNFWGDQTRDAYAYAAMHAGAWPAMGPDLPLERLKLPPLYYYLIFPFTFFSADPTWQAFPNALFSFLTIPLIAYALHTLCEGVPASSRLFLSAVGSLWWSVLAVDITLGIREWNPSSITFFSLLFVMIAATQIQRPAWGANAFVAWSVLGALLALLVSLHSTTLFVMPVAFAVLSTWFVVRAPKRTRAICLVVLALCIAAVCLTPYWQNEMANGWHNTRGLLTLSHERAAQGTPEEKIQSALLAYTWLSGQAYFLGQSRLLHEAGVWFLLCVALLALFTFRGNGVLLGCLSCVWIIFLGAASEYAATEIRYRLLIVDAPVLLTLTSLAFLDVSSLRGRVLFSVLGLGIIVSIATNVLIDVRQQAYYFGSSRLLAVSDIVAAFERIPRDSRLCNVYLSEQYIDRYVTHRELTIAPCVHGVYEIVPKHGGEGVNGSDFSIDYTNYELGYIQSARLLQTPPPPPNARTIYENEAMTLVLLGGEP